MSWYIKLRRPLVKIHLWTGLIGGLFIFLLCLSGTILTFQYEIEGMLQPERTQRVQGEQKLALEEIQLRLETERPGMVTGFSSEGDNLPLQVMMKSSPKERRGKTLYVNPYTAEVLAESAGMHGLFLFFFRMHRWLFLEPSVGSVVMGVATLIFIFLLFSGLYLWWPRSKAHLRNSLRVSFKGNWKRTNHDLHNTLGFYTTGLLLLMALTGLCWSFEWYRDAASSVIGAKIFGGRGERPARVTVVGEKPLPLATLLERTHEELPYSGKWSLMLPNGPDGALTASKTPDGLLSVRGADRLQLDPYTGEVLKSDRFSEKTFGAQIASLVKPLHTGEFFGPISKIIYFIVCLIGTSLPVTGLFIWLNKLKRVA